MPEVLSKDKDTNIRTTPPESQGGTAFCWSYAIVAHLEQRYLELTGESVDSEFRDNFSEEFLGLMHVMRQLTTTSEPANYTGEGLKLSQGLDVVATYGIVPEKIDGVDFFRPKFSESIGSKIKDEALRYIQDHHYQWPLTASDAAKVIAKMAQLDGASEKFILASFSNPTQGPTFKYMGEIFSPVTFASKKLHFNRDDYYILQMPDTGRGEDPTKPVAPVYDFALKILKKSLLYGYSVPISFNYISEAKEDHGRLGCADPGCPYAQLSLGDGPHANHAVLVIDFHSAASTFDVISPAKLNQSLNSFPEEWLIKNSWGFNRNTSSHETLLKRFPLPAFTIMTQDFFEASHRLNPGRYEALIPKRLCLRDRANGNKEFCEDFIRDSTQVGLPNPAKVNLTLNSKLLAAYYSQATFRRLAIRYLPNIGTSDTMDTKLKLRAPESRPLPQILTQVSLKSETVVKGVVEDQFYLCVGADVGRSIKYAAAYVQDSRSAADIIPRFVLSPQNQWQHCALVPNNPGSLRIVLQGIDEQWNVRSEVSGHVTIAQ